MLLPSITINFLSIVLALLSKTAPRRGLLSATAPGRRGCFHPVERSIPHFGGNYNRENAAAGPPPSYCGQTPHIIIIR